MPGSTYLSLVNQALVAFNEVPLTTATFGSAQGLQSLAKNAVNYSINHIYHQIRELPWAYERNTTISTSIGQQFYDWPSGTLAVDYDAIAILADPALDLDFTVLKQIQHEVWKRRYQAADQNAAVADYGVPRFVFRTPDNKIGLSGPPKEVYDLLVPRWSEPTPLSAHDDICAIPTLYDLVILHGTTYYIYVLRQNEEAIVRQEKVLENAIKSLRATTVNKYLVMQDTRIPNNGG
jgi:hypothetical protein